MDILTKYSPADTSGCTVLWSDKISKFCVVHLCTNTHSMITYHDMHMQCIFARTCIRITHALSACGTLATAWLQFVSWTNSDVTFGPRSRHVPLLWLRICRVGFSLTRGQERFMELHVCTMSAAHVTHLSAQWLGLSSVWVTWCSSHQQKSPSTSSIISICLGTLALCWSTSQSEHVRMSKCQNVSISAVSLVFLWFP